MLIKCPECELQVSDKAAFCPHCGYVITKSKVYSPKRNQNKRRRLPNGFGSIVLLKNKNLRKPYRALVTVRKTSDGKFIRKPLKPDTYFKTYNEAYEALLDYNRSPYDIDIKSLTMQEVFDRWFDDYRKGLKGRNSERTITAAWAYCSSLYDMPISSVRVLHLKDAMENGIYVDKKGESRTPSPSTKERIKSMFNLIYDYAVANEITDRNCARMFKLSKNIIEDCEALKRSHIPYTADEQKKLWDSIREEESWSEIVLIQCYMGWRPQELGLIELEKVDLENWEITGGMKTKAGTNRTVPIHPRIRPLVIKWYNKAQELNSEYLFNCTDTNTARSNLKLTYDKYRRRIEALVDALELNPDHRAHDGRNTFITMCKNAGVDEYAIKTMVGHEIYDITEKVYTKRDPQWLHNEILKIQ